MTRHCHSPDLFLSEPEPETDEEEAYVGFDGVEVEGMSCDDSYDSELDHDIWTVEVGGAATDGDISEDEIEDLTVDDEVGAFGVGEENNMEVFIAQEVAPDAEGDDEALNMFLAEEDDSDDEITRPARHLRNVVDSDDDGEVSTRAVHPPGTMAVFDELAPGDIDNPCEFQIKKNTVM